MAPFNAERWKALKERLRARCLVAPGSRKLSKSLTAAGLIAVNTNESKRIEEKERAQFDLSSYLFPIEVAFAPAAALEPARPTICLEEVLGVREINKMANDWLENCDLPEEQQGDSKLRAHTRLMSLCGLPAEDGKRLAKL